MHFPRAAFACAGGASAIAAASGQCSTDLCRTYGPIEDRIPDARRIEGRRIMGDLWPYASDAPVDWAWGLHESG
jgi:hypothetical protein